MPAPTSAFYSQLSGPALLSNDVPADPNGTDLGQLESGGSYELKLVTSGFSAPGVRLPEGWTSVTFSAPAALLIASVVGGSKLQVNVGGQLSLKSLVSWDYLGCAPPQVFFFLFFYYFLSVDLNIFPKAEPTLEFSWSCLSSTGSCLQIPSASNMVSVAIKQQHLGTHSMLLTVRSDSGATASVPFQVFVATAAFLTVSVTSLSPVAATSTPIIFSASFVGSCVNPRYSWEVTPRNLIPVGSSSSSTLTVSPMIPGVPVTATASVSCIGGLSGKGAATVNVANAPFGGSCTLSPTKGEALVTAFKVTCLGWGTENLRESDMRIEYWLDEGAQRVMPFSVDSHNCDETNLFLPQTGANANVVALISGPTNTSASATVVSMPVMVRPFADGVSGPSLWAAAVDEIATSAAERMDTSAMVTLSVQLGVWLRQYTKQDVKAMTMSFDVRSRMLQLIGGMAGKATRATQVASLAKALELVVAPGKSGVSAPLWCASGVKALREVSALAASVARNEQFLDKKYFFFELV